MRVLPGVVERPVELVDGLRPECVARLRPIEGDPGDLAPGVVVVGDVGEGTEPLDIAPHRGIEDFRDESHGSTLLSRHSQLRPPALAPVARQWRDGGDG